jgi:hypothetical protein
VDTSSLWSSSWTTPTTALGGGARPRRYLATAPCMAIGLIQTKHRIDRRCLHSDRRIIRCSWLCCFFFAIHPAHLGKRSSVHPMVSTSFGLLRIVPTTPMLCTDGTVISSRCVRVFFSFLSAVLTLEKYTMFSIWHVVLLHP